MERTLSEDVDLWPGAVSSNARNDFAKYVELISDLEARSSSRRLEMLLFLRNTCSFVNVNRKRKRSDDGADVPVLESESERRLKMSRRSSSESQGSRKGPLSSGATATASASSATAESRAVALVRMGIKKSAESRCKENKAVSSDRWNAHSKAGHSAESTAFSADKAHYRKMTDHIFHDLAKEPFHKQEEFLMHSLMRLQHAAIKGVQQLKEDYEGVLVGLAEATVGALLRFVQNSSGTKKTSTASDIGTSLEGMMGENFLVEPSLIGDRKWFSHHEHLNTEAKIMDHKLQVLYRMELYWLLGSEPKQRAFESDILTHLWQITFLASAPVVVSFLEQTLTPAYVDRQADLISFLHDKLSVPKPAALRMLISPGFSEDEAASVGPFSVKSEASFCSRNEKVEQVSLEDELKTLTTRNKVQQAKMEKLMRRMKGLDASKMQINFGAPNKSKAKVNLAKKVVKPISVSRVKPQPVQRPEGSSVKRHLSFDSTPKKNEAKSKTPIKKISSDPSVSRGQHRPHRLTPGKHHRILAPATPTAKTRPSAIDGPQKDEAHQRRHKKTDGVNSVMESPDLDSTKKRAQKNPTPRRVQASLTLRRKASFYFTGKASRNLLKASDNLMASKLMSQSQSFCSSDDLEETSDREGKLERSVSSVHTLFGHLTALTETAKGTNQPTTRGTPSKLRESSQIFAAPSGSQLKTPIKHMTPSKLFSPGRKVAFNMSPMGPAAVPLSSGKKSASKSILKTPLKVSLAEKEARRSVRKAVLFDAETVPAEPMHCQLETPVKQSTESADPLPIGNNELVENTPKKTLESTINSRDLDELNDDVFASDDEVGLSADCDHADIQCASPIDVSKPAFECHDTSREDICDRAETEMTPTRPCRRKSTVSRFGIDDISLRDVVVSPSIRRTPQSQSKTPRQEEALAAETRTSDAEDVPPPQSAEAVVAVVAPVATPPPMNRKSRLRSNKSKSSRKRKKAFVKYDSSSELMIDVDRSSLAAESEALEPMPSQEKDSHSEDADGGKFWKVSSVTESPHGEIKMRMFRAMKPHQSPFVQRVSRNKSLELGISPDRLRKIITAVSPVSTDKTARVGAVMSSLAYSPNEKENASLDESDREVLPGAKLRLGKEEDRLGPRAPLSQKKLSPIGLYDLITSPIIDTKKQNCSLDRKPSRASKRLSYRDDAN